MIDATCPLVTKVHVEAIKFAKQGYSLVLVGHRDHEEVEGTQGEAPDVTQVVSTVEEVDALVVPDPNKVAYLTQTTLSLDEARYMIEALKKKFPNIVGPHAQDICYATENRQTAVKNVAHGADLVLVVGSRNSSNSNRLVEVSKNLDTNSYLIDTADAIQPEWLEGVDTVAVTAGASAPEVLVKEVVEYLQNDGLWLGRRSGSDAGECALRPACRRSSRPSPPLRQSASNENNVDRKFFSWGHFQRNPKSANQPAAAALRTDGSRTGACRRRNRTREGLAAKSSSTPMATGVASWKRTVMLESDYIFVHTLLGTGDRGQDGARRQRDPAPSE